MSKIYYTGHYSATVHLSADNTIYLSGGITIPVGGGDGIFSNVAGAGLVIDGGVYITAGYGAAGGGTVGIGVNLTTATTVSNSGTVYGGKSYSAANGGAGMYLHGGSLTNTSTGHIGGNGNADASGSTGAGGAGVTANGATLHNSGRITAGYGGDNGKLAGGVGGSGVNLLGSATLDNSGAGKIVGGRGGEYLEAGIAGGGTQAFGTASGGAGVAVYGASASVTNSATITGGSGATGGSGVDIAASAGTATAPTVPTLYNAASGTITGGAAFNNISGTTVGGAGISVEAKNSQVVNHGTVSGGQGTEVGGTGVDLLAGSTSATTNAVYLNNTSSGVISGLNGAAGVSLAAGYVAAAGSAGVIYNAGTIRGGDSQSGTLAGGDGVYVGAQINFITDLVNTGTIQAGNAFADPSDLAGAGGIGVDLSAGGVAYDSGTIDGGNGYGSGAGGAGASVSNGSFLVVDFNSNEQGLVQGGSGGAAGNGGAGVYVDDASLEVTYATISGGTGGTASGDAVQLSGQSDRLFVGFGVTFDGNVVAGYGNQDTLYLEGVSGGTLTGLGTQITGFDTLNFEGSNWQVQSTSAAAVSTNASQPAPVTFTNFDKTDTLDVTDLSYSAVQHSTLSYSNGVLDINTGSSNYYLNIQAVGGTQFQLGADSGSGTDISLVPCYLRGTRILTERGELAIETLRVGDRIVTLSGIVRPITWIGRRRYSREFAAANPEIMPIKFARGALGDDLPRRDLWVSPDHAMLIDGMLIPAAALLNGTSITQDGEVGELTYIHLEFESHSVIYAEGAPAESFVDDDSRGMFDNAAEYAMRYPGAAAKPARFCAPRIEEGLEMESVRRRLAVLNRLPHDRAGDQRRTNKCDSGVIKAR